MPPRVLASGPKPCGGNNILISLVTLSKLFQVLAAGYSVCEGALAGDSFM